MRFSIVGLSLVLAAMGGGVRAQGIDLSGGGPVTVTSRGGFEWLENEKKVIASDDARAVRDNVTVTADRLTAFYRSKKPDGTAPAAAPAAPATGTPGTGVPGATDTGDNEVYRLEADGHVLITTPTDQAQGDRAIYDIDKAVLVMTGAHLKLTTPQQVLTARDSMEYWSQAHMAVGRGNAVVVTSDARRLAADVLVGYTTPPDAPAAPKPAAVKVAAPAKPGDPTAASGKLQRVEGFGNVEVRTAVDTVRGQRGVYVTDSGVARIVGGVRITHGQTQLEGPAADVNMKTGIAHLLSDPGQRVTGLIMPNDATAGALPGAAPASAPGAAPKPPAAKRGP